MDAIDAAAAAAADVAAELPALLQQRAGLGC